MNFPNIVWYNYEENHFREILSIIQLLVNHGATYKLKASLNDIFVTYPMVNDDGSERYCSRLNYVKDAINEGKNIQIITLDELLKILNVNETDLLNMPYPNSSCFISQKCKSYNNYE